MSPQLLTSLNFTWLLESSPVPEASIELTFLWKHKSSPTFDHSPSRDQQTSVQLHFFFFFLQSHNRSYFGEKKIHAQQCQLKSSQVALAVQCSGNKAAFGPLDDWGHSRDIAKLPFLLVLEPSAINASSCRK